MNRNVVLDAVGGVLMALAHGSGPFAAAIVVFAVEAVRTALDARDRNEEPVKTAQAIADRAVDLVEKLKVG